MKEKTRCRRPYCRHKVGPGRLYCSRACYHEHRADKLYQQRRDAAWKRCREIEKKLIEAKVPIGRWPLSVFWLDW